MTSGPKSYVLPPEKSTMQRSGNTSIQLGALPDGCSSRVNLEWVKTSKERVSADGMGFRKIRI